MGLFNDTVTIFNKSVENDPFGQEIATWKKTVVNNVQWSDHDEKNENSGRVSVGHYANITFPEGTYEELTLNAANTEDAIFYGEIDAIIEDKKGHRVSDLISRYPKSGRIKSVNDNSNRDLLKNIKVVIAQ